MVISKPELMRMFQKTVSLWMENKDYLSEIDSRFGDGDHGITIGKIAGPMERNLESWETENYKVFLEKLGDGGATGSGSSH